MLGTGVYKYDTGPHLLARRASLVRRRKLPYATYDPLDNEYVFLNGQGSVVWVQRETDGSTFSVDPYPWGAGAESNPVSCPANHGYFYHNLVRPLHYTRNRWYQSGGPGWISPDPIGLGGGDVNLYRY